MVLLLMILCFFLADSIANKNLTPNNAFYFIGSNTSDVFLFNETIPYENETIPFESPSGIGEIKHSVPKTEQALKFLLLGDWGKGGMTGAYLSAKITASKQQTTNDFSDSDDDDDIDSSTASNNDKNKNNNNDNKNNNNKNKNNKVFYQVPIARAMGKYTLETTLKPSYVIALGKYFTNFESMILRIN